MKKIKKIAVLSSGGDAPGMNAAVRAVVRAGIHYKMEVVGIERGYQGILDNEFRAMDLSSVANIIQRGGTILKTARCKEFHLKKARKQAVENLKNAGIEGLIVIGGNGSYAGAHALWQDAKFPVVGVPGTIDNDIFGTETTIGFDTAINTGIEAIDKIRDTASSHERIFIVEVMGRNSGHIAMEVGIGGGAEAIVIPEVPMTVAQISQRIKRGQKRGKTSSIIVVAEGKEKDKSFQIAKNLEKRYKLGSRVVILGHIQRGGRPTARDRKVASVMGAAAVRAIQNGKSDIAIGIKCQDLSFTSLSDAIKKRKHFHDDLLLLTKILAT